jgi:hypothetical protein
MADGNASDAGAATAASNAAVPSRGAASSLLPLVAGGVDPDVVQFGILVACAAAFQEGNAVARDLSIITATLMAGKRIYDAFVA